MILRADHLVKKYKSRTVVNDVSVEVSQGEIVGLLGPNGAGKTTTFYMTVGLIKPNDGNIFLDDRNITSLPMYKRAQLGIGYLPQEASVFRKLSVEDNLRAVLQMRGDLSKKQRAEKVEALLDEFGLQHVRNNRGDLLSGGERRRTEIARALASDPKFILLDEPFAGVDPIAVEDIQFIVSTLKNKNIGILITDHNVQETLSITERAYLMFEGKLLKAGTAEELAADPQVRKVYLGQNFELKASIHGGNTKQFLNTLNPVELSYMLQYKYPGLTEKSKETVDTHLSEIFMTKEDFKDIFDKADKLQKPTEEGKCPRCASSKLSVITEDKINQGKSADFAPAGSGKAVTVEKVTCKVCDYILSDPNRE